MTGLIILTFVPSIVALYFFFRLRAEIRQRRDAEARLRQREHAESHEAEDDGSSEWNAVLGHELRSPIAAILGYQELIEEGTFGTIPDGAIESVRRIGLSARQLLLLVEAVQHDADVDDPADMPESVSALDLCRDAIAFARLEADTRGITIELDPADARFHTRRDEAARALMLALGAAIKVSPDTVLTVTAHDGKRPAITITGSLLEPGRDAVVDGAPRTGAALRLEFARTAARRAGGQLDLDPAGTLNLSLPAPD